MSNGTFFSKVKSIFDVVSYLLLLRKALLKVFNLFAKQIIHFQFLFNNSL